MTKKTINLHRIAAEIQAVQDQLRTARVTASASDAARLDLKIAGLESLHEEAQGLCSRTYAVWSNEDVAVDPPSPSAADRRPRVD
jgi:hypothetical protein